ncbi:MAG: ABC transporter substrate-binding protein [Gammaproteobacteria bacterium]|nr:ABC transporter substrate-binding protein [Gammaproteobacteria bacterium]
MVTGGHIVRVALMLGVLALAPACAPEPEPPLRVGTNVWPGYEPLYLARDLGYLEGSPVRLVEYASATDVVRAFLNHAIEAAALTLDEALLLADLGQEPRVVLVMDFSHGADVILGHADTQRLTDLKGRRIGVESGALGAYVLTRALQQSRMSLGEVSVVPMPISEHERAFLQHEVDAVVTFEPVRTRLLKRGAVRLFDSSEIPGEIVDVLVVRRDILERQPEVVKRLLRDWFRALAYLTAHPDDVAGRMAPREGISAAEFLAALQLLRIPDLSENRRLLAGPQAGLYEPLRRLEGVMQAQRLLARKNNPDRLLDNGLLDESAP